MDSALISRRVIGSGARNDGSGYVDFLLKPAARFGDTSGWATSEPFEAQGVEIGLPNLRERFGHSSGAAADEVWRICVRGSGRRGVRITLAPVEDALLSASGDWLGIVQDAQDSAVEVVEVDDEVRMICADLVVCVTRATFGLRIEDRSGRVLARTAEALRQVAGLPVAPAVVVADGRTTVNLELASEELVSGFGEQFSPVVKNGRRLSLRVEDAQGTATGLAYKPVPVWHSNTGYMALVNTGAVLDVDVASTRPNVMSLTQGTTGLDVYFLAGSPRERLRAYVDLTGRSEVPPLWAFGYWIGRCRYHDRAEVLGVAEGMATHDVPCDVVHLDPDWLVTDRLNNDFIWNADRFGPRGSFLRDLNAAGRRLSLWELPYVDPSSPIYPDLAERGFLVTRTNGDVAKIERTSAPDDRGRALVDFGNPAAVEWWIGQHQPFMDDGVAVFKTDFGEGLPPDAVLAEDTPSIHHHNLYPLRYNKATHTAMRRHRQTAPMVWARSGWAGSHRYPAQWGGDAESTVAGMRATVRGGISFGMSAPSFWGHDVGGFFGHHLSPGLYVRWTQLGAMSPLMRAHGLHPREPWEFGESALGICRTWIRRRYALLPYLWNSAHQSVADGLPLMRALSIEYPDDAMCEHIDGQYLLGSDLMVIPIFDERYGTVRRSFYVPHGDWRDLYTEVEYAGGRFHTIEVEIDKMPVLIRRGSTIPYLQMPEHFRNTDDLLDLPWRLVQYGAREPSQLVGFDGRAFDASRCE